MTPGSSTQSYQDLLVANTPRPITSEKEAEALTCQMDALIDRAELTNDERDYLVLIGLLLAEWERDRVDIPRPTPLEALRALIEDNGLRQRDLVGPVFPTESIASEVIRGKRPLTYEFVQRLAGYFHVSPELFFTGSDVGKGPARPR